MAERRMFTKKITESDAFLDMPSSTQALYFHLNMAADDDGFVNNPKKIQRMVGSSDDDMKVLISKRFIITFESGVIVIKHWKMHNYIQNDRYKPTDYIDEKSMLELKKNKAYTLTGSETDTQCIQNVYVGKVRLGKDSIGKVSIEESIPDDKPSSRTQKHKYGEYLHVLLTDTELENLKTNFGETETQEAIKFLDEYIEMKGTKYKSHNMALRKWVFNAVKERSNKKPNNKQTPTEFYDDMKEWANRYDS